MYALPVSRVTCLLKEVPGSLHIYACVHIMYVVFNSPFIIPFVGGLRRQSLTLLRRLVLEFFCLGLPFAGIITICHHREF